MISPLAISGTGLLLGGVGLLAAWYLGDIGGEQTGEDRPNVARSRSVPSATIMLAATGAMVVTFAVTRWPVAALLAGVAAMALPSLIGQTASGRATRRVEAVAVWTELLRDTLAASAGLGQAIVSTADLAPSEIREPVSRLTNRLANGIPIDQALRKFADDVNEPSADVVVCALLLAASAHAQKLTDVLTVLAESCRQDVAMRLRVEASRASARSSVRTVVVFSLTFAGLLLLFARSYLSPFGSSTGEAVLALIGTLYASGLWLMVRLVRPRPAARLLKGGLAR